MVNGSALEYQANTGLGYDTLIFALLVDIIQCNLVIAVVLCFIFLL